jgi:hypothetical protein
VSVCNSDPAVVSIVDRWIRRMTRKPVRYWLQYHADQDVATLTRFWGGRLGVPPDEIRLQRKSNSNQLAKRTWRSRYGVLSVTVGDTWLHARIQGWMDCLREEWG